MRIIGGQWGSRELDHPAASVTRPMPDRVKQAIFDMLGVRFESPGALPPIQVCDFFAGSGSLGLEALSRGAAHCWFHERHRVALAVLRNNVSMLNAEGVATVVPGDAWRCNLREDVGQSFQLAFLDPPYRDAMDSSVDGPVLRFLARLSPFAAPSAYLVLHHPTDVEYSAASSGDWSAVASRRFGTNGVTLFSR